MAKKKKAVKKQSKKQKLFEMREYKTIARKKKKRSYA